MTIIQYWSLKTDMLRLQLGSVNRCLSLLAARKKINFHDKLFYPVMLEQHMTMRIHVVRRGLGRCQHLLLRPPPREVEEI